MVIAPALTTMPETAPDAVDAAPTADQVERPPYVTNLTFRKQCLIVLKCG